MNGNIIRVEILLADLSAYMVAKYGMTPRDASGLVMQSQVAELLREENSTLLDSSVEQLAAKII